MCKRLIVLLVALQFCLRASASPESIVPLAGNIGELRIGLSPHIASQLKEAIVQSGDSVNTNISSFYETIGTSLPKMGPGILKVGQSIGEAGWHAGVPFAKRVVGSVVTMQALKITQYFAKKYIERYVFEPALIAQRSSRYSLKNILSWIRPRPVKIEDQMIISDSLRNDLQYIMGTTKNIKKHGGQFENVLLLGAPGTGKTLFAQLLAEHCGMDYAIVPAANVSQFLTKGTVVEELNNLFAWAESSRNGTIIFFDEAETFLSDRSRLDIMAQNALSAFLAKTGMPSNKIMIICTTNRPEVIDKAVLSRLGLQVEFALPDDGARRAQLQLHIKNIFERQKGSAVAYDYLKDSENISYISAQLEGCSGRTIQKFVNRLRQYALAHDSLIIDTEVVNRVTAHIKKDLAK